MFYLDESDELQFQLVPALPGWLVNDKASAGDAIMDEDGQYTVSFKLFGSILVTYHNPDDDNLYGVAPKKYTIVLKDGTVEEIEGESVPTELALKIRRNIEVASIDAYF